MRTDFDQIDDGASVMLIPNANNPLHRSMTKAVYANGYFHAYPVDTHAYNPYIQGVGRWAADFGS